MLGLSLVAGRNPRIRVYLLATESTARSLSTSIESEISCEIEFYTPKDEFNDLDVLVQSGNIRTILVADFPDVFPHEGALHRFFETVIVPVERVIIVESFERYEFASEVMAYFPQKARVMSELEICNLIAGMASNAGGNTYAYTFFVKTVAISSLVLAGVGGAFCGSRVLESGSKSLLRGVTEGAITSSSVFVFIQWIYLKSSIILETPIALHTTTSNLSAISSIGPFGGGTVPRILFAATGLTIGILLTSKRANVKISLRTISTVGLGLAFLLGGGGRIVSGSFLGSRLLYYGYTIYNSLGIHNQAFSRGVMIMFVGLMFLGMVPNLKSELQSLVIPFSIITSAWGIMRAGDMRLEVALWSFLPGIILGIQLGVLMFVADTVIHHVPLNLRRKMRRLRQY